MNKLICNLLMMGAVVSSLQVSAQKVDEQLPCGLCV